MMGEFSSSSACRQQLLIALPHFITTPTLPLGLGIRIISILQKFHLCEPSQTAFRHPKAISTALKTQTRCST